MRSNRISVPTEVYKNVCNWHGKEGARWCKEVPALAEALADKWCISLGPIIEGSTHALVVKCRTEDGEDAVFKLPFRNAENMHEALALRLYRGIGSVKLINNDIASGAMLLEFITPGLPLNDHPDVQKAVIVLCEILSRLRHQNTYGFDSIFRWMAGFELALIEIFSMQAPILPAKISAQVLDIIPYLRRNKGELYVVNRDPHFYNVISSSREPWLLIDPKPVVADIAFEGAQVLLNCLGVSATRHHVIAAMNLIVPYFGGSRRRLLAWALVRAVHKAVWSFRVGELGWKAVSCKKAELIGELIKYLDGEHDQWCINYGF